jgi:hypothetical protein
VGTPILNARQAGVGLRDIHAIFDSSHGDLGCAAVGELWRRSWQCPDECAAHRVAHCVTNYDQQRRRVDVDLEFNERKLLQRVRRLERCAGERRQSEHRRYHINHVVLAYLRGSRGNQSGRHDHRRCH